MSVYVCPVYLKCNSREDIHVQNRLNVQIPSSHTTLNTIPPYIMLAMLDPAEIAKVLDIMGNRNRRRIIELLRQKPCFVTEISERLMISPKAVIEHLQMMEKENILAFRQDDRRRKYYFLATDISIVVNLQARAGSGEQPDLAGDEAGSDAAEKQERLMSSVQMLRRMIESRQNLVSHLEDLDHDIDRKSVV